MTTLGELAVVGEMLDRQAQHVVKAFGGRVMLALPGFLSFIDRNAQLAGLVQDLVEESSNHWQAYEDECDAVLTELRSIWASAHEPLERVRAADGADSGHWSAFDGLGGLLAAAPEYDRQHTTRQPEAVCKPLRKLKHFVACGYDQTEDVLKDPALEGVGVQLVHLEERLTRAWTLRRLLLEAEGGAAYLELRRRTEGLVPGVTDGDEGLLVAARNMRTRDLWGHIESSGIFGDAPEARSALADFSDVQRLVDVLHLALQTKLAEGRSRAAVVRRYVARCESFDRARLLEAIEAAKANGRIEGMLTLDFARYLFDVGFNPIVDPEVAGLRPDVLDPASDSSFYVEAKQYKKTNLRQLQRNVAQVFDTWGRLRNRYDLPEAFLLVFRRGGRLVELPAAIKVKGRTLHLHLVDLALAGETGSRAKNPPLVVEEKDLLPKE